MSKILTFLMVLGGVFSLTAQKNLRVVRNSGVDWSSPVANIFVGDNNEIWVANRKGVYRVLGNSAATPMPLAGGEVSLLSYPGGNANITWSMDDLKKAIGDVLRDGNIISTAFYDTKRKDLWLGTTKTGLFQLKLEPTLKLVRQVSTNNSKLKSDYINTITADVYGKLWVGTQSGVLTGNDDRWELLEKSFDIRAIATNGTAVWLLGDGLVGPLDRKGSWLPIIIPDRKTEGKLEDIVFDAAGALWIASEIISRYDPETEEITIFGPAQEYTSQFPTCMAVDQDGRIWIGTEDKGLYVVQEGEVMAVLCKVEQPISCTGNGRDARLSVVVSGGKTPYNYQWSVPGLQGENPRDLGEGSYQVTVTDANGTIQVGQVKLVDPRLQLSVEVQGPAGYGGLTDGRALVKISGGQEPYTYRWDSGESTAAAAKLGKGPHQVTVTDKAGCRATAEVTIPEGLAALAVTLEEKQGVRCAGGKEGALSLQVSGGKTPYTQQWSLPSLSGNAPTGLAAGTYSITITDAIGNKASASVTLTEPSPLQVSAVASAPAGTNKADGQAKATAKGGDGQYSYRWDTGSMEATATGLAPGEHQVTVTDSQGCSTTAKVAITENILPLAVTLTPTAQVRCAGGKEGALQAEVTGGKGPFTYQWNIAGLTGSTPSGLAAGSYQVTVTDAAGTKQTAQIDLADVPALKATAQATAPASTNNADGQAKVTVTGGDGKYNYRWDTGSTEATATGLAPGEHQVTVTDSQGCSTTAKVAITENILPLAVTLTPTAQVRCAGGKEGALQAEVTGGKGPFTYQWNASGLAGSKPTGLAAGTYLVTVTDAVGTKQTAQATLADAPALKATAQATAPASTNNADGQAKVTATGGDGKFSYRWDTGSTEATVTGLAPGEHQVTVTDNQGCSTTAKVAITENILPLAVTLTPTAQVRCAGGKEGALQAEVTGGKGPFTYQWNASGLAGSKPSGLAAGTYLVTVTDAVGTKQTAQATLADAPALKATAQATAPASTNNADGQAKVTATGGDGKFSYRWDTGSTEATATGLAPGEHQVTVTDSQGCSTTAKVAITENILPLAVALTPTAQVRCAGGKEGALQAEVTGGKGPFTYQWNANGLTGSKPSGLAAGNYLVTVTDAVGTKQTAQVTLADAPALKATTQATAPASTNNADGQAKVTATGGDGKFSYRWDNGSTEATATGLAPGEHQVTVTDSQGCNTTAKVAITENILPLVVTLSPTAQVRCAGGKEGALQAEVTGGKGPFTYQWNANGLTGSKPSGLAAGNYLVTVTDAVGTKQTAQVTLADAPALKATTQATAPASTNNADGQAKVTATGGDGKFSYRWDTGSTEATATGLAPGEHQVTVTDSQGCSTTVKVAITENILPLEVSLSIAKEISCTGQKDGAVNVVTTGGKAPYKFTWSEPTLKGNAVSGLSQGSYQVTVTDVTGQTKESQISLQDPAPLTFQVTQTRPATTAGSQDGKAGLEITGGAAPYAIQWASGENTQQAARLAVGQQGVTITDARGCQVTGSAQIGQRLVPGLGDPAIAAGTVIQMEKLVFQADSTSLPESAGPILDEVAQFLLDNPSITVEFGGHTNNLPPDEYCDRLSTGRARAVAAYMTRMGVSEDRVKYRGYGKRRPLVSNDTPEGRIKNQRVEITIQTK
ncbi:MAG: OmpA family protein [Lewinellaceae bacterium]|nr:OmpA family protein [Lewinellaceae bacterium]